MRRLYKSSQRAAVADSRQSVFDESPWKSSEGAGARGEHDRGSSLEAETASYGVPRATTRRSVTSARTAR